MTKGSAQLQEVFDRETCWALLERVAESPHLKNATRLRELLRYVGRRSLIDGSSQVHEHEIGCAVFNRSEGYDTALDNIVRTNVSYLRKRIEAYFESEGAQEPLILEIPRGSYIPVFRSRPPQVPSADRLSTAASDASNPGDARKQGSAARRIPVWISLALIATTLSAVALAVSCFLLWKQYGTLQQAVYPWKQQPAIARFWSAFLDSNLNTDVILSDNSYMLLQRISNQPMSFNDYLARSYIGQTEAKMTNPEIRLILDLIAEKNLGNVDEFKLAQRIQALDPQGTRIHVYGSRQYMPALVRQDNVVVIGSHVSDPWEELFDSQLNFDARTNFGGPGVNSIINRAPAAGEPNVYISSGSVGYCVVAYLPNPEHSGRVLLIEGTNSEATEAAGDFFLSEDQLSGFFSKVSGSELPYFEVVLKTSEVRGTPLVTTVEAYRTYPRLH